MSSTSLAVVNYVFDPALASPEALLERYDALFNWCRFVARTGVRVRLVQAFSTDAAFTSDDVEWVFRKADGGSPFRVGRVNETVLQRTADVVHVNGLETVVQAWLLRRALPAATTLVVQDHGGAVPRSRASKAAKQTLMRGIDGFLFTSRAHATPWIDAGLVPHDAVHEVLEASSAFRPMPQADARVRTGMSGRPAILWVGRLQPNKDPLTVIEGYFRCADRLPASTLTMIFREADLLDAVRRAIAGHPRHSARVRLVGEVPHHEMPAWYSAADVFVLGSASEVCGYSALEACACGALPVLSDIAAFRALTGHGTIGRLWRRGDAQAVADAFVDACASLPAERARITEFFDANLSWDAVAQRACDAYAHAAARRRRTHRTG